MATWSTDETAALKASFAESLGINEANLRVEALGFEVKAAFILSGIAAREWAATPAVFADAMRQELGFPVNVTGFNVAFDGSDSGHRRRLKQSNGPLEELEVWFTVQGLKDIRSTLSTMAKIVEIAPDANTAMSGRQGAPRSKLLGALTAAEGQIIQVSELES
jgi:hypothetical protein